MKNRDIKLNALTHDIEFNNFDLQIVDKKESVAQRLKVRLQTFITEWFLDQTAGIPYYEKILKKNPDILDIEIRIKEKILTTPNVISIERFQINFEPITRRLEIRFTAKTNEGEFVSLGLTI